MHLYSATGRYQLKHKRSMHVYSATGRYQLKHIRSMHVYSDHWKIAVEALHACLLVAVPRFTYNLKLRDINTCLSFEMAIGIAS